MPQKAQAPEDETAGANTDDSDAGIGGTLKVLAGPVVNLRTFM